MSDRLSPEKRSWNMSRIKAKDTSIEIKVRHYLFSLGFRYRKNDSRYPGKPDIILPKYKTAIFINGCFWHRHPGCKDATTPKTNTAFWEDKFARNIANDEKKTYELNKLGYQVIVLWECEINNQFEETMSRTITKIKDRN